MKQHNTKKLFFAEYLYKLVIRNELSHIFATRHHDNKNLGYARVELDRLAEDYRNGIPLAKSAWRSQVPIPVSDYHDAMKMYTTLKYSSEHKLRIDYSTIAIFSNDKEMLTGLAARMATDNCEFWGPDKRSIDFLLTTSNVIIVDTPPKFEFKVTFSYKRIDPSFADWLENNQDKSSVGSRALDNIKQGHPNCVYIYVRDEKILTIVQLLVGSNIQRVDKLVAMSSI